MIDILSKIIPNQENDLMLLKRYLDRLNFFEKEQGKWYLKSHDSDGREKLVLNAHSGKSAPEEIVRQLFLFELTENYGYPISRLKCEQSVSFGRNGKGRADIVVYQEDCCTPWILVEVKAPNQKNSIQQLKSYLNNEGSPRDMTIADTVGHITNQNVRNLLIPNVSSQLHKKISKQIQTSHVARNKSRQRLNQAKHAVELFIEEGEEAALKLLEP
jgi:predicted type IV restriction endonuclease